MLRSKLVQRLLRLLIALCGAGLGVAATMGALQIYRYLQPTAPLPLIYLAASYIIMGVVGGLVFYLLSSRIMKMFSEVNAAIERYLDKMSLGQLTMSVLGLIAGMIVAALLSQVLAMMGQSIFTTASSGVLYVVLGLTGFSVGRRRGGDLPVKGFRRKAKTAELSARAKLLDASAVIDGRILEVCRTGFVEGELVVPGFVLEEVKRVADSSEESRRLRGRRGLDVLTKLQEEGLLPIRTDETDYPDLQDTEVKLLRLAKETGAAVITGDQNLHKLAALSGVKTLDLSALAHALRPVVIPGERLAVQLVRTGKEPGQGVGYQSDGTMIVVDGGGSCIGQTVTAVVTSVLQTSAGRMIFARIPEN